MILLPWGFHDTWRESKVIIVILEYVHGGSDTLLTHLTCMPLITVLLGPTALINSTTMTTVEGHAGACRSWLARFRFSDVLYKSGEYDPVMNLF